MSTITIDESDVPAGLGHVGPRTLVATSYRQGGRTMFSLALTLQELTDILKRPNPETLIENNRRVDEKRAKKYAEYISEQTNWVSPAIIVRAPQGEIEFSAAKQFPNGTAWGALTIPLQVLGDIVLLDGQHRTLGTFIALETASSAVREAHDMLAKAKRNGDIPAVINQLEKSLDRAQQMRSRLANEHISIDFALVDTDQGSQMFVDIANNAKGVNPDFTSILDQRDIVNRITTDLIEEHELLHDRVEIGQSSRMTKNNENLMGAKNVSDLVRTVLVGINGRVGRGVASEIELNRVASVRKIESFLGALVGGIPELIEIMDGNLDPRALRDADSGSGTLIGSSTMMRVLAGVFHETVLAEPPTLTVAEFEDFLRELAPRMREVPIAQNNALWIGTGAFLPDAMAPMARQGSLRQLVNALKKWSREGIPA